MRVERNSTVVSPLLNSTSIWILKWLPIFKRITLHDIIIATCQAGSPIENL